MGFTVSRLGISGFQRQPILRGRPADPASSLPIGILKLNPVKGSREYYFVYLYLEQVFVTILNISSKII